MERENPKPKRTNAQMRNYLGFRVRKEFFGVLGESEGFFNGLVDSYLISQDSYHIVYDHGVEDVVPYDQMQGLVRSTKELLQAAKSVGDVPRTDQLPQAARCSMQNRHQHLDQIEMEHTALGEKRPASNGNGAASSDSRGAPRARRAEQSTGRQEEQEGLRERMCAFCKGPTLGHIFQELTSLQPQHKRWLGFFEHNCQSYGWEDCRCSFWESRPDGLGKSAYCQSHGAEALDSNVRGFLCYFIPRKMGTPSGKEMKKTGAALRALVKLCVTRGYCGPQPELLKEISTSTNFPADEIRNSIEALAKDRYWDSLEEEADEAVVDDGFGDEYEDFCGGAGSGELFVIKEVRADGWINMSGVLLRLPPEIARMGKKFAALSCMRLALRNGVWRPVDDRMHPGMFLANVYPP